MKRTLLIVAALLGLASPCLATPSVGAVTGNVNYGGTISFLGAGFGVKPVQQKTFFLANFNDAAAGVAGTTWCVTATMTNIVNVARATSGCFEGAGCAGKGALSMSANNNNTAAVTNTDVGFSGKLFASWIWQLTGTTPATTGNWKTWRWWSNFSYNNIYGAQQLDSGFVQFVENTEGVATTNGVNRFYTNRLTPTATNKQMEIQIKINSTGNATDGQLIIRHGGSEEINSNTFQSSTINNTNSNGRYSLMFPIHMVWTGSGSFNANNDFRYDNIIIDTSWCQAWFTTNSTNAAGGDKLWLAVQTWADGTITAVVPFTASPGTIFYAYARNNDGTVNANGYPVTFGGSGAPGDPPATLTPETDLRSTTICPCTLP